MRNHRQRVGAFRPVTRTAVCLALSAAALAGFGTVPGGMIGGATAAGASTTTGTVDGEGGAFLEPVMSKLLQDDGTNLLPDYGSYVNVDIDRAISDFVGTGAGQFGADFVVSERPLTSTEAATAQTDGRTFAYVPFAATPVAVVTLVPSSTWTSQTIQSSDFCQHIPLSLTDLADLYGYDAADPVLSWNDSRFQCSGPGTTASGVIPSLPANLDPTMENYAMMALLDSTPASEALFQAGLNRASQGNTALTTSTTPSEFWPYAEGSIAGGDQTFIGKMIGINARTNAPSTSPGDWNLGATFPVSSVWTGSPLGTPWNLPTAAIENAAGDDVPPSTGAAVAAEADASLATTSNPTTNNLVTFNANSSDTTAYNNFLMEESYLVVPLNGLPADKAVALAQFIRFVLSPTGQADISSMGAAPATQAMVTAGLAVAQQVDAESAASNATTVAASSSATTTTTVAAAHPGSTAGASTTTTSVPAAAVAPSGSSSAGSSGSGTSSSGLAFTGSDPIPLVILGVALVVIGELSRRRFKRRGARL
jgi:ABC-type phosphate transport system substrate-binding protein